MFRELVAIQLSEYYLAQGWKSDQETSEASVKQQLSSDKHDLTIMDGLVVAPKSFEFDAEALLDESYEIEEEIFELKQRKLKRGLFGGLIESEALEHCLRPLILMNRQCEIKQILQGQFEPDYSYVDRSDAATVQTVGDYLEALLQGGVPDRVVPGLNGGGVTESSVDAVD